MASPLRLEAGVPHDRDAEEAVLAAVLVDPEFAFPEVSGLLSPADFYLEHVATAYQVALTLYERGEGVNIITVVHELARSGQAEAKAGQSYRSYVSELIRALPTAMGARHYATLVARESKRRKLITLGARLQSLAVAEEDPERVADLALDQLVRAGITRTKPLTRSVAEELRDGVSDEIVAMITSETRGKPAGFSTGWDDLDRLIDGLVPGNLITLLADIGMGKSFFVGNLARNVALMGKRVHLFSTEMTRGELAQRAVWMDAAMDPVTKRFGASGFTESDIARVMAALGRVDEWAQKFRVTDQPGITLEALRAEVRREAMRAGTDVLFVDHAGHVRVKNQPDPRLRLEAVCRGLKELAVSEHIPVWQVCHVNREAQKAGGRISYNDAKDSSAIEQESDRVLTMFAVDDEGEPLPRPAAMEFKQRRGYQLMRIEAAKHRSGPASGITMRLQWPEGGRFLPVEGVR